MATPVTECPPAADHPHWLRPAAPAPGTPAYWRDVYRDADAACRKHPPSPAFRMDLVSPVDVLQPDDFPSGWCPAIRRAVRDDDAESHAGRCERCMKVAEKARDKRLCAITKHHERARVDVARLCAMSRRQQVEAAQVGFGF